MTDIQCVAWSAIAAADWDAFVRRHPHHGPGHLSAALRLDQLNGATVDASFAVVDAHGTIVAVCPLVDTQETTLRMLTTRVRGSGTWFAAGPLVDAQLPGRTADDVMQCVVDAIERAARRDGVHRLALSYPAVLGPTPAVDVLGYLPLRRYGYQDGTRVSMLLPLQPSEEVLFAGMESRGRRSVRRAEGLGCVVDAIEDAEAWRALYPLYAQTLGALAMSRDAFAAIYPTCIASGDAYAVRVQHEGRVVNVVTVTIVNGAAYYWLGFGDRAHAPPGANVLGLWRGICLARARGAAMFEIGSLDFSDDKQGRIAAFKQQFGGRPVVAFHGTRELAPVRAQVLSLTSLLVARVRKRRAPEVKAEEE